MLSHFQDSSFSFISFVFYIFDVVCFLYLSLKYGLSITQCLSQKCHTDHEKNAQGVTLDVYDPDKPVFSD